tara:strand:+ start:4447 stop:4929 length:483 start_codon:yes stop_codon:yes gene_type:complete
MIKVESKISIHSDCERIWKFLNDISLGLSFNRFHKKINIENSFSLKPNSEIIIEHNFGFGAYDMILEVVEMHPPKKIIFEERAKNELDQLFFHRTTFSINKEKDVLSNLNYIVEGTFNNKFADMSFKPILKGVMLDELIKIKLAIESSQSNTKTRQYNPA